MKQQMDFKTLAEKRYSVRSYSGEPVSEEQIDYIMECARLAPSAVNLQPWRFYVMTSAEDRASLQRCYKREWLSEAPLYILCTVRHDEEWVRRDGKRHGDIDIAIAAEHICLAAADLGLGSCWVCNFDAALCSELFGLSADESPLVIIPIGKPAGGFESTEKKRKPAEVTVIRR